MMYDFLPVQPYDVDTQIPLSFNHFSEQEYLRIYLTEMS
jgi:hypothetical protein